MTDTVHSARHPRRTGPTLADIAARYVREHRIERQSRQLTNRQTATLTVIQNRWAAETGRGCEDITTAPKTVIVFWFVETPAFRPGRKRTSLLSQIIVI